MTAGHRGIRVLVVDDHEIVRRGVVMLLEEAPDIVVCGEAGDTHTALDVALATEPDVALIDVRLGRSSGIALVRTLCERLPETRALMLTAFADDDVVLAAMMAGAAGYLLKDADGGALLEAIRRVAAGDATLDPSVTAAIVDRLRALPDPLVDPKLARLSPREIHVLELVAGGLTNRAIAVRLVIAEKTVKNHVTSLLAKLEMSSRAEAAAHLARHGPRASH